MTAKLFSSNKSKGEPIFSDLLPFKKKIKEGWKRWKRRSEKSLCLKKNIESKKRGDMFFSNIHRHYKTGLLKD